MSTFSPIHRLDGYLPLEDDGLIGDGTTAGLVGRDGAISWLCLPRFDSPPVFCGLLDSSRGGAFTLAPEELVDSRQFYEPDSAVLVTEMRTGSGLVRITDALALRSGADLTENTEANRGELLRFVTVLHGRVRLQVKIKARGGAQAALSGGGLKICCPARPDLDLHLFSSLPLNGLHGVLELNAGDQVYFSLRWRGGSHRYQPTSPEDLLKSTVHDWHRWIHHLHYDGPQVAMVRRSAITLKLLDHFENGAMVAAPTSSLPEAIGGSHNWDYRYSWVRDAAFSVYALRRIGLVKEAEGFLGWVLDAIETGGRPRVLYNLDGQQPPPERTDPELEGYRGSRPVRWGNAAADQLQHDIYGEILDCACQWAAHGNTIDEKLWGRLRACVDAASREWNVPDHGIWEVRTAGRPFTYSAALCHVALDRGTRLAERFGFSGDVRAWRSTAEKIRQAILEQAWDPKARSLTEHLGEGGLDASLLSLPLRRVIRADDPRMVATTAAIQERLGAGDGLLFRYLPEESPDGLSGHEGAFLLCSFWLVDNLAYQGRIDEALELYESLCGRAGTLGLLPEEIDPGSGAFLGNHPQAFSHIGVISSGLNLSLRLKKGVSR